MLLAWAILSTNNPRVTFATFKILYWNQWLLYNAFRMAQKSFVALIVNNKMYSKSILLSSHASHQCLRKRNQNSLLYQTNVHLLWWVLRIAHSFSLKVLYITPENIFYTYLTLGFVIGGGGANNNWLCNLIWNQHKNVWNKLQIFTSSYHEVCYTLITPFTNMV